jgi:CheY-like chemotaxis protein
MEQPASTNQTSTAGSASSSSWFAVAALPARDAVPAIALYARGAVTNDLKSNELQSHTTSESDSSDIAAGRKPFRILIADDHEALRRGLRSAMLGAGWQVVGEAADGLETVEKVKELVPDLVLLDLSMPVMNGHDAAREILRAMPGVKIVVFTMHESQQVRDALRKIGVHGLAVKSAPLSLLLDTIQNVLEDKKS